MFYNKDRVCRGKVENVKKKLVFFEEGKKNFPYTFHIFLIKIVIAFLLITLCVSVLSVQVL